MPWIVVVLVVVFSVVREQGWESTSPLSIPDREPESDCLYNIPDDFFVMTLPDPDEKPGVRTLEEKRKAFLKLLLTVFAIDAVAVIVYLFLVHALGWDEVTPFILLIVITVITGFYFQWQNKKITDQ